MKPNFILGVGCQKGGTTWLYSYLASHPEVRMSPTKEMHIFDALFLPELFGAFYKQSLLRTQRALNAAIKSNQLIPDLNIELNNEISRLRIYHDMAEYPRYFMGLANSKPHEHKIRCQLVGEISPTYGALDATHLSRVRNLLKDEFNIRVLFLMRDPIDRIWSQQRMIEDNPGRSLAGLVDPEKLSAEFFTNESVVRRTAYDRTIASLEEVFAQDELYYGFYETLFSEHELRKICSFLGISYVPAEFGKKVNQSRISRPIPDMKGVLEARHFYDPTYRFCADRFGEDLVRRIWPYFSIGRPGGTGET